MTVATHVIHCLFMLQSNEIILEALEIPQLSIRVAVPSTLIRYSASYSAIVMRIRWPFYLAFRIPALTPLQPQHKNAANLGHTESLIHYEINSCE